MLLRMEGMPTATASNITDTLHALHAHPSITVIIADVRLRAESGYDIPRTIQMDPDLADRPIQTLFMTGEASLTEHHAHGLVLGKPFDIDQFVGTLSALLEAGGSA